LAPKEHSDVQQPQQSGSDRNSAVDGNRNDSSQHSVRFKDIDAEVQNVEDQGNENHQVEADDLQEVDLHIPPIQIAKPSTEQHKSGNHEKDA